MEGEYINWLYHIIDLIVELCDWIVNGQPTLPE